MIIERAIAFITELFGEDPGGHDADHSMRVYRNALLISENEPGCDKEIVLLAALLHDVDDRKLFHTENNANARRFLTDNDIPENRIDRICEAINAVSFSQNKSLVPESLEGRIVQDADRLDALGAIGIARTFAYGGLHGRPLKESVQHFYDKLILLKDTMNTETAKQLAESRHEFLLEFIGELEKENFIGGE